ncbi:MaoC/PaaZ C-terminal domain-containing protein [soil metagenome]
MIQDVYFEDYHVGALRSTLGRTITESDIVIHAGQTGDFYPHHMDAEWCKGQEFGQRVAHGTLIFSIAVGMTAGAVNTISFSYGYDKLRFIKPVFIGDTITCAATIVEKRDHKRPEFGMVVEHVDVINQRNDLVLVCDHLLLVQRRESIASA